MFSDVRNNSQINKYSDKQEPQHHFYNLPHVRVLASVLFVCGCVCVFVLFFFLLFDLKRFFSIFSHDNTYFGEDFKRSLQLQLD